MLFLSERKNGCSFEKRFFRVRMKSGSESLDEEESLSYEYLDLSCASCVVFLFNAAYYIDNGE